VNPMLCKSLPLKMLLVIGRGRLLHLHAQSLGLSDTQQARKPPLVRALSAKCRAAALIWCVHLLREQAHVKRKEKSELDSQKKARQFAREVYESINPSKQPYVVLADVQRFFPHHPEDAQRAYERFDRSGRCGEAIVCATRVLCWLTAGGRGFFTRNDVFTTVQDIYNERKFLTRSLLTSREIVRKLDYSMMGIVLVADVFVWLSVFGVSVARCGLVLVADLFDRLRFSDDIGHIDHFPCSIW
jgi:hypothetical protein